MKKKILSVILAACLGVSLLVGCGGGEGSTNASTDGSTGGGTNEGSSSGGGEESADNSGESVELKMIMVSVGFNLEDAEAVEEKLNEYIQPKIHATVDIEWLDMGEYINQMNLKLTGGETIDIMPTFGTMLSSLYGQEFLTDMSGLIQEYGQDIVAAVGEDYLKAGEIDGKLYSVPVMTAFAKENCLIYRTDIAEECGVDLSSVKEVSDLTPILAQIHEKHPEYTLIVANSNSESMLREWAWDGLGDEYGVLMDPTNSTTIANLYETEEYKEYVTLMHEWYEAGYIMTDAATTSDNLTTIFDSGTAFGTIAKNYPGNVESKFGMSQYEFAAIPLGEPFASTNQVTDNVMTIPVNAAHPEKAMEFLNLLYSDATVQNYMCYGIEGQNYRVVDEEKGIVDYLEGENMMTCKYVNKYLVGNPLIAYTEAISPEGIHETLIDYNLNANRSKALGFSYNSANVSNEISALSNVCSKYRRGLECGSLDPETELPKFIQELKAAGIDKVVEEKQTQLDAWLAEQ